VTGPICQIESVTAYELMGKTRFQAPEAQEAIKMAKKPIPICDDEKQTPKEWKPVTFEYAEDGISVQVPNVYAWVSPLDGEISFTPDTVDELIATVRELIETAKRAQQRRNVFTEYVVSVGLPASA